MLYIIINPIVQNQIIHETIKLHCFYVLVGNNIFRIQCIIEIFMKCAIHTWKLCLLTVLSYNKIVTLHLDEKVKSIYNHLNKNNSSDLYLCVIL